MLGRKRNLLLLLFSILIFVLCSTIVNKEIAEQEKLVIACVDLSETFLSKEFITRINRSTSFEMKELSFEESMEKLSQKELYLFFVLPKNFSTRIEEQDLDGVISTYYYESNYYVKMMNEVLYSELLYSIHEVILHDYVEKLSKDDDVMDWKQQVDSYMKDQYESRSENYFIESTVIDFAGIDSSSKVTNMSYVQLQSAMGMMFLFLGYFCFSSATIMVKNREEGIHHRILLTSVHPLKLQFAYFLYLFTSTLFLGIIMSSILYSINPTKSNNGVETVMNVSIYVFHLSASFLLIGYLVKGLSNYMLVGISYLMGMGIVGGAFFDISLMSNTIRTFFSYTPLYAALNHQLNLLWTGNAIHLGRFFVSSMIWFVVANSVIVIFVRKKVV